MTSKRRKYGDLSKQPLPTTDPDLIKDVFRAFTGQSPFAEETDPGGRGSVASSSTVLKNNTVLIGDSVSADGLDADEEHVRVSRYVSDILAPQLTPTQWAVYYRLYRLSHGIGKKECLVGNKQLRELTGVKETAVRDAIAALKRLGLVKILEVVNTSDVKGTRYQINVTPPADV